MTDTGTDSHPAWVWLWQDDGGDYYAGRSGALYRDGERVWQGSSSDVGDEIARAILGEQLSIRDVRTRADLAIGGHFHPLLADTLEASEL